MRLILPVYTYSYNIILHVYLKGPIACTRIKKGKGVCGQSWDRGQTIVVPDVDKFPGHIGM